MTINDTFNQVYEVLDAVEDKQLREDLQGLLAHIEVELMDYRFMQGAETEPLHYAQGYSIH